MDGGWKKILFFGSVCVLVQVAPQADSTTSRAFILVERNLDWLGAWSFCTDKYEGLATITTEANITTINRLMESRPNNSAWIGLHDGGFDHWRWSLPEDGFNASAAEQYQDWQPGQPDNEGSDQLCVSMMPDGLWRDNSCTLLNLSFVCSAGENETDTYAVVYEGRSWVEAQAYCRLHYTDLASVRSLNESQAIQQRMQDPAVPEVWIGLHRDSWMWSDGTNSSFSSWSAGQPDNGVHPEACVSMRNGTWSDTSCSTELYFICQGYMTSSSTNTNVAPVVKRRGTVVKMKLRSSSDLEVAAVRDGLLQQLVAALKTRGVTDVKLTWRTLKKEPQPTKRDPCGSTVN